MPKRQANASVSADAAGRCRLEHFIPVCAFGADDSESRLSLLPRHKNPRPETSARVRAQKFLKVCPLQLGGDSQDVLRPSIVSSARRECRA